jgi:hypothetical protein
MSLRDSLAASIHHARDVLRTDQVDRIDVRAADLVLALLRERGIGHWVTTSEPTHAQVVIIDLGGDLRRARYDLGLAEFRDTQSGEVYGLVQTLGWMALP